MDATHPGNDYGGAASSSDGALTLRVVTPEGAVFDGVVESVVVPSHDGETAFLKDHAAFVGLLGDGELRFHRRGQPDAHYYLGGGVVQVLANVVTVLAETVIPVAAIDIAKVEREIVAAEAMPGVTDDQIEAKQKALDSARTKLRLAHARTLTAH